MSGSWIYGKVGVPRPMTTYSQLQKLEDAWRKTAAGYSEASESLADIKTAVLAKNQGPAANRFDATLDKKSTEFDDLSSEAALLQNAHAQAASALDLALDLMDAACVTAADQYAFARLVDDRDRALLQSDALHTAHSQLVTLSQGLVDDINTAYSGLTAPADVNPFDLDSDRTRTAEGGASELAEAIWANDIDRIEEIFARLEREGVFDDPLARVRFIESLGPDAMDRIWDLSTSYGHESLNDELRLLSRVVADATHVMSLDDVRELHYDLSLPTRFAMMRLSPWETNVTATLVDDLVNSGLHVDWTGRPFPEGLREEIWPDHGFGVGLEALGAALLADQPDLAHDYLTDPSRAEQLKRIAEWDSPQTAHALEVGLLDGARHSQANHEASARAFASLIDSGARASGDHTREALAHVGGLFLDDFETIARRGIGSGTFHGVSREEFVDFYHEVFKSEKAVQHAGSQVGVYYHHKMDNAFLDGRPDTPDGAGGLRSWFEEVDRVSLLFEESLQGTPYERSFGAQVATTITKTGISVAAGALPNPATPWAGMAGGMLVDLAADAIFAPREIEYSFDWDRRIEMMTVTAMVDHHAMLDPSGADIPYGLTPTEWARLSDPGFMEQLASPNETVRQSAQSFLDSVLASGNTAHFDNVFVDMREVFRETRGG